MSVSEWIGDMPLWFKTLMVTMGITAVGLLTAGLIEGVTTPFDSARGDIVHGAVSNCLLSISGCFFASIVLFIIAYACAASPMYGWFPAIVQWACILVGIFSCIGGTIIAVVTANFEIQEYDRLYNSVISVINCFVW